MNTITARSAEHTPVLLREVVDLLAPEKESVVLDGTVGAGGHAEALLERMGSAGQLVGLDLDPAALRVAAQRLARFGKRVRLLHANFRDAPAALAGAGLQPSLTHTLLDLGVSSIEFETSGRGFSFQRTDEVLDMRFDPDQPGPTAATILNRWPVEQLAQTLRNNGEEPNANAIARSIVLQRRDHPFERVRDLVHAVLQSGARNRGRRTLLHPATRTFQALRIAVNDELENLRHALPELLALLTPGGKMAVISFHSLEDRIVKEFFKRESADCICPPAFPVCRCGHTSQLTILTKHVVTASDDEQRNNPRSRSAKLRVAQKQQSSQPHLSSPYPSPRFAQD